MSDPSPRGDLPVVGQEECDHAFLVTAARRVCVEVWRAVDRGVLDSRSPLADAALDLRDNIDPSWHPSGSDESRSAG